MGVKRNTCPLLPKSSFFPCVIVPRMLLPQAQADQNPGTNSSHVYAQNVPENRKLKISRKNKNNSDSGVKMSLTRSGQARIELKCWKNEQRNKSPSRRGSQLRDEHVHAGLVRGCPATGLLHLGRRELQPAAEGLLRCIVRIDHCQIADALFTG